MRDIGLRSAAAALHSPVGARLGMAASLPRLAGKRSSAAEALSRALRTLALGRIPDDERAWARRIESRRARLFSVEASAQPYEKALPGTVSQGSRWVSMPPRWTELLMRVMRELQPETAVELGTGLGISTAYQAAALALNESGSLLTIDGSAEWMAVAEEGLRAMRLDRVQTRVGPIRETLAVALEGSLPVDYALVDAEHTEEATIGYFEDLLPHLAPGAVIVFDDIPWTSELRRTWHRIANDERVAVALPLGRVGVVITR